MTLGFTKSGIERAVRHGGKAVDFAFKVAMWVSPLTLQMKNKSYEKTNFQAWAIPWKIFNICSPLCSGSTRAGVLTSVIWLISSSFSYVLQHSGFILLLKLIHSFYGNSTVDLVRWSVCVPWAQLCHSTCHGFPHESSLEVTDHDLQSSLTVKWWSWRVSKVYLYFVVTGCSVVGSCWGFSYPCKWGADRLQLGECKNKSLSPLVICRTLFYKEVQRTRDRKTLQESSLEKDAIDAQPS